MRKKFHILYSILALGLLLGVKDGYITLWKDGSNIPIEVFPCHVRMLPPADQHRLEQGIRIGSQQELMQLLEDYLS